MMCASAQDLKALALWDGMHGQSRSFLLNNLSSTYRNLVDLLYRISISINVRAAQ